MMERIYLDFNATTPVHPEVAKAMHPYIHDYFGNPSSSHWFGIQSKLAVEKARMQVAAFLNCHVDEIVFTSGGTEANNTAIKGIAFANKHKGNHIITSSIEHPAVLEVCRFLEKTGFAVNYIPVDKYGLINPDVIQKTITPNTILISIMHANNEVGTIQPIRQIAEIAEKHGIIMHTDAAQSAGKIPVDVQEMGVDLLSLAGHKLYAPKGIGALYIKNGIKIEKLHHGADHERNLRAGTENVLEIVGLGKACEFITSTWTQNVRHMKKMRDHLHDKLQENLDNIHLIGHPEQRLPNTLNIGFAGLEANTIISELHTIAASAGAACHTDQVDISHVLIAMKVPENIAMGAIRFSTGYLNTAEEINTASEQIIKTVRMLQPDSDKTNISASSGEEVKLTHFTHGLGCACKIRPDALEEVLKKFPVFNDENILVDLRTNDDAAVYKIDENHALVGTVDFFTPIVDDPYDFGAIAASNSLSDIYAMGGKPLYALNIVGFPSRRLSLKILEQILKGANDKAKEAGIRILGGHTIDDTEPKFGLTVTGIINPNKILRNSNAQPGDVLILTKPIGTGIISTAIKRGIVSTKTISNVSQLMASLNMAPAEVAQNYPISACTDISGYGLLGHLIEMARASKVDIEIYVDRVPIIPDAYELAIKDIIPGGTKSNLQYAIPNLIMDKNISYFDKILLSDAQTSGGLLFSLPDSSSDSFLKNLHKENIVPAIVIGKVTKKGKGIISLTKK